MPSRTCARRTASRAIGACENDVLDRFYHAALAEKPAKVVRITADCPLIDPEVIDRWCGASSAAILITPPMPWCATIQMGWIRRYFVLRTGTGVHEANKASEREHVTPYLRSEKFRTANVENDSTSLHQHYRWTVDEVEDLNSFGRVQGFSRSETFGMKDVWS